MTQENINPRVSKEQWLDHYVYAEIHKNFFALFPSELYEWIKKLENSQGRCSIDKPIVGTSELVHKLEASGHKLVWAVEHWLDQIIRGFITKFTVDMTISYNKAEWPLLKGPQGKYVKSLKNWIKMPLCEKRVMQKN